MSRTSTEDIDAHAVNESTGVGKSHDSGTTGHRSRDSWKVWSNTSINRYRHQTDEYPYKDLDLSTASPHYW